ncbi:putative squalene monooxygenase [Helianthus debilis subsp. tardiflorus]
MRQACFDYLSLVGICSQGPISSLSGLNRRLIVLFLHFFLLLSMVLAVSLNLFPSPKPLWLGARFILGATGNIFPIIKSERVRQMYFPAMVAAYYKAPQVAQPSIISQVLNVGMVLEVGVFIGFFYSGFGFFRSGCSGFSLGEIDLITNPF